MQTYSRYWLVLGLVFILLLLPGCKASPDPANDLPKPPVDEPSEENGEEDETEENGENGKQDPAAEIKKDIQYIVAGDSLALRKTPGTKDKGADDVLVRLKKDQAVYLQDKHDNQVKVDGYTWWEIYDPASQVKGWSASEHLGSADVQKLGTVEGSITYPAGFIPDGLTVVVEDVATGQEYTTNQVIYNDKYRFGAGFVIKVPPGNYYVYAFEPNTGDFRAYYDEHMQSNFETDSYEKIVVSIPEGQHVDDILVGNWWRDSSSD